jgi:tetratricopeptide (TPR) repeat protein
MDDSSFNSQSPADSGTNLLTNPDIPRNPLPKFRPEVEFQIAKLWEQKGKVERAIAGYRKVLAIVPTHWQSLAAAGELLIAQGEQAEAIALYQKAIQHQVMTDQVQQVTVKLQSEQIDQGTSIN